MPSETEASASSATEVRALLGDYAKMLRLRGDRTVLLGREALATLEKLASAKDIARPAAQASLSSTTVRPQTQPQGHAMSLAPVAPVQRVAPQQDASPDRKASPAPAEPAASPSSSPRAPVAQGSESKAERLEALRKIVTPCRLCEHLAASRTQTVFGVGNPDCDIMFVGEAPGADEDKQGEPFVGAAGQLLTKMIAAMGITRADVYIANVLKCRPDMPAGASGNRKPQPAEMRTCLPYLQEQIAIIQPKVLVALGLTAIEGLRGVQPGTITLSKMRGQFTEFEGIPLMPTFHPAYLLRNQAITEKRKAWEDLMKVMKVAGLPISERQRNYFLAK